MYITIYITSDIMRNIEKEDCGCSCRCGGGSRGMRRHMGFGDMDLTNDETAERLRYYKDDLTEEIKLIDKRIADLKAEDTRKGSK
jgi:hypothetical protein